MASLWRVSETSKPTLEESEDHFDAGWELHEQSWAVFAGPPSDSHRFSNPKGDYLFTTQVIHGSAVAGLTEVNGVKQHAILEETLKVARRCIRIFLLARDTLASDLPSLFYFVSNCGADFVLCFNQQGRAAWGVFTQPRLLSIITGAPSKGLGAMLVDTSRRGEASRRPRSVVYAIEQLIIRHPHFKSPRHFVHVPSVEPRVSVSSATENWLCYVSC